MKIWLNSDNIEWAYLADKRNGFAGNEDDDGTLTRRNLGKAARDEVAR